MIVLFHSFCSTLINNHQNQYEEYDLDEQDFQWLVTYNQFRIEKRKNDSIMLFRGTVIDYLIELPEIDENIFEYIMQLLEQQCLTTIRQKSYEDTIQCDACRRVCFFDGDCAE